MNAAHHRPLVTVLYVGSDLTSARRDRLRMLGIGVVVAESGARAQRTLAQFRPSAMILATPDLKALASLIEHDVPIIVLAAASATSDLDRVTIMRRNMDPQQLAGAIHGLVATTSPRRRPEAA